MPQFFVFSTEVAAVASEAAIVANVQNWLRQNAPDSLSEDGESLRGRNASSGELVNVYTDRWAVPRCTNDGRWVFAKPTDQKTAPIPAAVFLAGVVANEADYDPAWFASHNV